MQNLGWLFRKARDFFGNARVEAELEREISSHLALLEEDFLRKGMSPEEAHCAAKRAYGGVEQAKQMHRDERSILWLEHALQDLRFSLRMLAKNPGLTFIVLATLALGIGANTAVFSVLNSVLFRPLPYPNSEELVQIFQTAPGAAGLASFSSELRLSPSMYFTYSEHNRSFQALGIWAWGSANITGLAEPEQVHTTLISDGVLEALRVPPAAAGRWLSRADQDPHGPKAVMLSYGYWQQRFGADQSVIGHNLMVDSQLRQIVGVMPRGFRLINTDCDVVLPLAFDRSKLTLAWFGFNGIARLKPGITSTQANADITRMLPIWMDSWSDELGGNSHFYEVWRITPAIRPLKQQVIGNVGNALWVVMGTVGIVMLMACANVANLLLVRAEGRQQELAVRTALGAGRGRIIRQLLVESTILGLLGGALGVGLAYGGLRLLVAMGPADLPRLGEISLDARALGFTLVLSLLSGLIFGLAPALKYAGPRITFALQSAGRTASVSRERNRSRNLLVITQVAMALILLVSAGLMIRTFQALRSVEPGFTHPEHLETMRISIPASLVASPPLVTHLENNISDKLATIPGATSVGFASELPMEGIEPNWNYIFIEGKNYAGVRPPLRLFNYVSPGYFHTAGTTIVAGREFTCTDVYNLRPVTIISENLARELWGTPSAAVGKRVSEFQKVPWYEVIGVVENVRQNGVHESAPAIVYWPTMKENLYGPSPLDAIRTVTFAVRSDRAGTESFLNEIQKAVWSVNSNLGLASVRTMQEIYSQSMARTSFTLVMLGIAGAMALVLGIIGIYGVLAYAVSQRRREIGIRLALGARQGELRWMFVRSGLALTAIGAALGMAAAVCVAQFMKSLLFGISPLDPATYITVPLVLIIAAVLASYLPARRAASVNPVEALRAE